MSYYMTTTLNSEFDDAISLVTEKLKEQGFGVLTEIDVKQTLKKKLDVDFYNYKINLTINYRNGSHKQTMETDRTSDYTP